MTTNNATPLDHFRSWSLAQPAEIQDMIGGLVCTMLPVLPETRPFELITAPKKVFIQHLDSISSRKSEIVGAMLFIRAAIDYKVVRKFGTADEWEGKQSLQESIIANIEKEHGANPFCDKLRENLKSFPERQAAWIKSMQSWRVLRNTALSDEMIEAWENSQKPEFPSDEKDETEGA